MKNIKKLLFIPVLALGTISSCFDTNANECPSCPEPKEYEKCETTASSQTNDKFLYLENKAMHLCADESVASTSRSIVVNVPDKVTVSYKSLNEQAVVVSKNGVVTALYPDSFAEIVVKSSQGLEDKIKVWTHSVNTYFTRSSAIITGCVDTDVEELTFPQVINGTTMNTIGANSFNNYPKLKKIVVPEGYTVINEYAFSCLNVESISYPASLTRYYSQYFPSLKNVEIAEGNTIFKVYNNSILAANSNHTSSPNRIYHVFGNFNGVIPNEAVEDGVDLITCYAFSNIVVPANEVIIPEGFTTIHQGAFIGSKFKSITIPYSLTFVSDRAFLHSRYLEEFKFGAYPLEEGQSEEDVDKSITKNGKYMIKDSQFLEITKSGDQITAASLHSGTNKGIIPDGTTSINSLCFAGKGLKGKIKIPSSVTEIKYGAFIGNPDLKAIYLPNPSVVSTAGISWQHANNNNFINLYFGWNMVDSDLSKLGICKLTDEVKKKYYGEKDLRAFSICGYDLHLYAGSEVDLSSINKVELGDSGYGGTSSISSFTYPIDNISEEEFNNLQV